MRHIPNILSGLRIALIPFFMWQILTGHTLAGGLLLFISAVTDVLDGNLARHFNWISDLGKILDPAADKLTQTAVSVCLMIQIPKLWFFFAILIVKDWTMLILGGRLTKKGVKINGSRWFGKLATVVFYIVTILMVLLPDLSDMTKTIMLTAVVGCALGAGIMYLPDYRGYRKEQKAIEE